MRKQAHVQCKGVTFTQSKSQTSENGDYMKLPVKEAAAPDDTTTLTLGFWCAFGRVTRVHEYLSNCLRSNK